MSAAPHTGRDEIVALCGGVGGAKLALGLQALGLDDALTVVVNTGDDFEHLGFTICPDIDTVLYTLGGVADRDRGWGRADETWSFMEALTALGGDDWFRLGDRDLATHVMRRNALRSGRTLTEVTQTLARSFGIDASIEPMCDAPVRTRVRTDAGDLPFQAYFVRHRAEPRVLEIVFDGADAAAAGDAVTKALASSRTSAVVVCPSNPYLSIDPILAVPGMRDGLRRARAPVVAVSPVIAGKAVKGPTAKIMAELGVTPSAMAIAEHYRGVVDGLVIDAADRDEAAAIESLGMAVHVTATMMHTDEDKACLAEETLRFASTIRDRETSVAR